MPAWASFRIRPLEDLPRGPMHVASRPLCRANAAEPRMSRQG